jgi:hypothetical protein
MGISFMFDVSVPNPEQFMFISSDMIFHLIFSLAFALFAVIFIAPSEILFKHTPYTTSIERFCIVTRSVRQNYEELKLSVENQRGYVDISMDLDEEDIKEVLRIISKLRAGVHELAKLEKKKSIKLEYKKLREKIEELVLYICRFKAIDYQRFLIKQEEFLNLGRNRLYSSYFDDLLTTIF